MINSLQDLFLNAKHKPGIKDLRDFADFLDFLYLLINAKQNAMESNSGVVTLDVARR